jgi:hypothetical protein
MQRVVIVVGALLVGSLPARANPDSGVIDVMPAFWSFWSDAEHANAQARKRLFRERLVQAHPELFTREVLMLDAKKPFDQALDERLERWLGWLPARIDRIRVLSSTAASALTTYRATFVSRFPDLDYAKPIYLLPSLGSFDGGVRQVSGEDRLLFGLDTIAYVHAPDSDLEPLFHHELFHVYHGQFQPPYPDPMPIYLQLWIEGLAVHATRVMHPKAKWSDLLLNDEMVKECEARLPALAREIAANLDDVSPERNRDYFLSSGKRSDLPKRVGYCVGWRVAEGIAKTRSWAEVVRLQGAALRRLMAKELESLAR